MEKKFDFMNPPSEYGEVSFFWWHGDDITKEKLHWILEQLKDKHICGLQINYCHGNEGGLLWGLTMESNPKPLSKEWWELVRWFVSECKKYGMSVSLSDYTLGSPGQQYYMDWVLEKYPEMIGQQIVLEDGEVKIVKVPNTASPIHPGIGMAIAEEFYGAFERNLPGECGSGINYFFSDELNFNIRGNLWSDDFAEQFMKRKGYDITKKWNAIFEDIGQETPKIRLDYYDVIVQLSEERYFKVIYDWHEERGMTFGCDHGGRGKDVTEFGDYFRTMKWNQGPGNDQPGLASDIIKSKVSASIAHLYKRPRVWLEGFYGSGWATSCADVADATFRNYALGHNLLSLHGLYYSTHGSMWEWAPPCNHHHMPYWRLMDQFLKCTKRLSYLNAIGVHRCDVAIIYPVAAVEADSREGATSVTTAFDTGRYLYTHGIDFDYIDFESIDHARIEDGVLSVAGEEYRAVIIPAMKVVRYHMMTKLYEFQQAGGIVIVQGDLPNASDRVGREDAQLDALVHTMVTSGYHVTQAEEVVAILDQNYVRDFTCEGKLPYYNHRIIEGKDYYMVYRVSTGSKITFRSTGIPVLLDPWTGEKKKLMDYQRVVHTIGKRQEEVTEIRMPLMEREVLLVMFETEESEGKELPEYKQLSCETNVVISMEGAWNSEVIPTMDNTYGDWRLPANNGFIGVEGRELSYYFSKDDTTIPQIDDNEWNTSIYSYGTYFWTIEGEQSEETLVGMTKPIDGMKPYRYSLKTGVEGDAGPQHSFHGLKGYISDDFMVMGEKSLIFANSDSKYEGEGPYYFFTTLYLEEEQQVYMQSGSYLPEKIWIDHKEVAFGEITLSAGRHYILLCYPTGGRTHFIMSKTKESQWEQSIPLSMKWYQNPDILPFDAMPERSGEVCWYRVVCPPGTRKIKIESNTLVEAYVNETKLLQSDGVVSLEKPFSHAQKLFLCIPQTAGYYDTAAILEPIEFTCEQGLIHTEQSLEEQGFAFYSGGIKLSKKLVITKEFTPIIFQANELMGCGMEVWVNDKKAATMLTRPYRCDITQYVNEGENEIMVYAYNTAHQHMKTIPTNYNHIIDIDTIDFV